jgi:hypothetical protein
VVLDTSSFPGHDLVLSGIADLEAGNQTESALLVAMAAPRLRAAGIGVPESPWSNPSHLLYEKLCDSTQDPHSRYNALVGRIVSFARAAENAASR